tara:strand:+ start:5602 stop:6882 length:1281 start_codon:yes stop_codon:yes gene_type:complete
MSNQKILPIPLKYRPSKFSELIGQDLMAKTIQNAIQMKRVANAFLLTGVRGVGKTTTARIIAKSLNCTSIGENNEEFQESCGECENCLAIAESRSVDVFEMDAASRTGISDIRELIEGVQYAPVSSRYKIYIIDEVHMLSTAAFNGLLKTLEEPPAHVKFIFATTEVRKIPTTILSRCQRYDLKRVEPPELIIFLTEICNKEGVKIEDGALKIISRAADGSVRDGLSILDQSISYTQGNIGEKDIKEMIGLNDPTEILDLLSFLISGTTLQAIEKINNLYEHGADPSLILKDLIVTTHQVGLIKIEADEGVKSTLTESEFNLLKSLADKVEVSTITMIWQMLNKGTKELSESFSPISALEMLFIRISYLNEIPNPNDLVHEISKSIERHESSSENQEKEEISAKLDPKVKEILDFFPGAKVETLEN